jgi:hypothetical protein
MLPDRVLAGILLLVTTGASAVGGGILREVYYNVNGNAVSDLLNAPAFPNSPNEEFIDNAFEAPSNFADSYGQRMRALLVPPLTGAYVFWIASDDNSALYLSTDEDPAHKVQIASVNSWTSSREWTKEANQQSAGIPLTNGFRYYIEALQKEGAGGDNLAVRWQLPGGVLEEPIPGGRMAPYGLGPPIITVQPANVAVVEGGSASFTVQLSHSLGATFQWQRGETNIPGATNSTWFMAPVVLLDSDSSFRCMVTNSYGSTNSASAILTVNPDVTRPTVTSVGSLGDPQILTVTFSELVEPASATLADSYSIDHGVFVLSAKFGMDARTIILGTTPMATRTIYTLTINNVRDRATTPNPISPNTQRTFTLDSTPLDISFLRRSPESAGPSTRRGPIIISEIMYHPTNRVDGKNLEFIELFNSNPYFEDIGGFRLSGQIEFEFPSNTVLAARSYLAVAPSPPDVASVYNITNVIGGSPNKLASGSGTLRLRNRQGGIVFEVNYSSDPPWPAAADGTGHSLVLARPSLGERNSAAWSASDVMGGSPGRADSPGSSPYRSVVINEFLAHTDPPDVDFIELFNYSTLSVDLSGCFLSDDPATNKFVIPTNTIIQPQGFVYFDESQMGFALSAAGETIYFKDRSNTRVIDAVRFGGQENGISTGRYPDGAAGFRRLQSKTPGAKNGGLRVSDVAINEILYDPISGDSDDEYVELYNRSGNPIDLSRWSLAGAIKYTIPLGTSISPGGYLVVAKNVARMLTVYPNLTGANTLGDFEGTLGNGGEQIELAMPDEVVDTNAANQVVTNTIHIVVDDVTYGAGGRWGKWAHGGGSSLELIDPHSDHRLAPNWTDSDEIAKSGWTNIEFTGVLDNGAAAADSLQVILLGPGECLVDNVEVFVSGGPNLIQNPGFESGMTSWVAQGNHEDSAWETGQGYNSGHCLHIRAADRGDTGANRIRTTLKSSLSAGQTATIRAKVRWLAGCPELLLRLHGNWLEATGNILTARNLGTPGAPNSRGPRNVGPAITEVRHSPVLPSASQAVRVVARVHDPDDLATLLLKYRVDPSTNLNLVVMVNNGAGLYSATIPVQSAGTLVAFHIQALDNDSTGASTLFPNDAPGRECLVRWGDPGQGGTFGTYRLWMTQATLDHWSNREHLSNKPLDCTFVYGPDRAIYNTGGQYAGSPYHAPGFNSPVGNVCDYALTFPDDDPLLGETDATLQWPGNGGGDNTYQREQTAYWIGNQIGLPYCYRRHVNLFINGVRRAQMFEDVQQPNSDMTDEFYPDGANGDLHKVQLWFEFDDAAANFSANGASLQKYLTTGGFKKLAPYRWTFAKRAVQGSASNYTNLFSLVDAANFTGLGANYRRQLESVLDVDNWLGTYAVEHIVGNNDSFAFGGGQNMYAYKPAGATWQMMIWDIDFAFISLGPTSDVFQGIGRSIGIDLGEPAYLRRYWQILQDLATGPLVDTKVNPILDAKYLAMTSIGRSVDNPSTIKTYLSDRRSYLLGLIAANVPSVFSITLNGGADFGTSQNLISLTGTAPIDVRTITINGVVFPVSWTSVSNWTAQVALAGGLNALTVQGFDAQGNPIGTARTINVNYTGAVERPQDKLVINEIMYNPLAPAASFVEIYNTSAVSAFDLSGWRLSGADFIFPGGTVISRGGFLVVAEDQLAFASAYGRTIPLAGEFSGKLNNHSDTLRLIKPGPVAGQDELIDQVTYESVAPWPAAANGTGASLQLIDPNQDNNRVANWDGIINSEVAPQWQYVTVTGSATSSRLYVYLQAAGDVFIDDIQIVSGPTPGAGTNYVNNGGFETALAGPWNVTPNCINSSLSTAVVHSGNNSLHLVCNAGGTSAGDSIWQDLGPLVLNAQYTLSYWCFSTNVGTLTLRLSNSGLAGTGTVRSDQFVGPPPTIVRTLYTPGATNSVRAALPPFPLLWLNEVQPNNVTGITDRLGHHHPWVELRNSGTNAIDLGGYSLANNYTNLTQWTFPTNTLLNAGQFRVVYVDGNPGESTGAELHTGFSIPPSSGSLALSSLTSTQTLVVDYLNYNLVNADRSYGAFPDGNVSGRRVFFYATPGGTNNPASAPLNVFINEWMADNATTLADPADNDFEDWFEIYNPGETAADLSGFYLGTSLTNKTQFRIPDGYQIPPRGCFLVWADEETGQNRTNRADLHAGFKLSRLGESIGIFAPDGTVIDFVSFGPQETDVSDGRFPDGSGSIYRLTAPTPRALNFLARSNTPPVIDVLADRVLIEGQLLLFTATATDTDAPPQTLTFSLDSGAPDGATINPSSGLFSWRPGIADALGTHLLTVRVTDDGAPPMSGTQTLAVRLAPRPQVTGVTWASAAGCAISFVTVPDKTYNVEFKNALDEADWQRLGPGTVATGDTLTVNDAFAGSSQRFYRIVASD